MSNEPSNVGTNAESKGAGLSVLPMPRRQNQPWSGSPFLRDVTPVHIAKLAARLAADGTAPNVLEAVPAAIRWLGHAQNFLDHRDWLEDAIAICPADLIEVYLASGRRLDKDFDLTNGFSAAHSAISAANKWLKDCGDDYRDQIAIQNASSARCKADVTIPLRDSAISLVEQALDSAHTRRNVEKDRKKLIGIVNKKLRGKGWPVDEAGKRKPLPYDLVAKIWFPKIKRDTRELYMVEMLPFTLEDAISAAALSGNTTWIPDMNKGRELRKEYRKTDISEDQVLKGFMFFPFWKEERKSRVRSENARARALKDKNPA